MRVDSAPPRPNRGQNKRILSNSCNSGHLSSFYSLDMPPKSRNNECPDKVAKLDHIGMLSGVKKVNNRLFARVD